MTSLLVLSLLLFSRLGPITLALSLAIATLSALYSLPRFDWKGRPLLNSGAHLTGGILHFLLGYSLGNAVDLRGLGIAAFFALIFAAGHLTQEIRDYRGDAVNGIRTNAVVSGNAARLRRVSSFLRWRRSSFCCWPCRRFFRARS